MNASEIFCMVTILVFLLLILIAAFTKEKIHFNANTNKIKDVKFVVVKIEQCYSNDPSEILIAKYTIENTFFSRNNSEGFKHQTFCFYDKRNKYKIGDVLTLCNE
jgi:hypothetical protein